jgi:hypothetical protein
MKSIKASLVALLGMFCMSAYAAVTQLTFEGLQNNETVLNFYNGGTGSLGSVGPNVGVAFDSSALAIIDSDAGGGGSFANEPSPSTIVYWVSGSSFTMNVAAGFDTGYAFFYSSSVPVTVTIYDGLNGTGSVLATANGPAQHTGNSCVGDPTGTFCNWTELGVTFSGVARSVVYTGSPNQTGFDNITFGSASASAPNAQSIPTLSEWSLLLLSTLIAIAAVFGLRRRLA